MNQELFERYGDKFYSDLLLQPEIVDFINSDESFITAKDSFFSIFIPAFIFEKWDLV